ncbi:hypothetical protein O6P43_010697 [Quillaja saponaria]|uniref:Uncharacterized protein n=1 Tax=Quillaja saponaria TaxID=32244 RepID=A0AAD7Q130_QUISA|nr:hypothetical protein O6P43_010697 [Quillaja saponaria]
MTISIDEELSLAFSNNVNWSFALIKWEVESEVIGADRVLLRGWRDVNGPCSSIAKGELTITNEFSPKELLL